MFEDFLNSLQYEKTNKFIQHYLRSSSKCLSCNRVGHISSQCYQTLNKCIFCTSSDHKFQKCPENLCHVCQNPGHIAKNCLYPELCTECSISGHPSLYCLAKMCPISSESLIFLTCLTCRKSGHCNCSVPFSKDLFFSSTNLNEGGHAFAICSKNSKNSKTQLIKKHAKEKRQDLGEFDRKIERNERKWGNGKTKGFRKIIKINKLRKKTKEKSFVKDNG